MGRELFEFAHVRYESHVCPVQDQSGRPRVRRAPGARTRLPRFIAATLVARGIDNPAAVHRFLAPSLERDWLDPYIIPGLSDVADALEAAVKRGDHILVFGDFDLDGISATTVLTRGLRALGAQATPFIPLRFEEGYALSQAAITRACSFGPDFIVTVDCGIACKAEAAAVVEAGLGLAITDHHEPVDLVPEGVPVADPKCDANCPSSILAGVGVALKLVQVLGGRLGQPHLWRDFTDFATLGTVADLMPMRDENRALVSDGIARMNAAPRPCIAALLATSGAADKPVSATNLSFSVIPRLNAAGRMGDAQLALDLLMADDFEEANRLATKLESVNDQRRAIEAELSEIAKAQAAEIYHGQRARWCRARAGTGREGHRASRLVNTYGVPACCSPSTATKRAAAAAAWARSACSRLWKAHPTCSCASAGTMRPWASRCRPTSCRSSSVACAPTWTSCPRARSTRSSRSMRASHSASSRWRTWRGWTRLAPFGQENPVPCFLARDVTLTNCRAVGAEKNHFSCTLSDGRNTVAGIMFHCTDIEALSTPTAW